jgi:hypothetical protein
MIDWLERLSDLFPSTELPPDPEGESEVSVERRFFLSGPALLAAWFLLGRPGSAFGAEPSFEEVTKQMGQLALPMIKDPNRNEIEYLFQIASLAAKIKQFPAPTFGAAFKDLIWSAVSYRGSGIAVLQWRMEPNTAYPAHNHPGYSGITVGIRGDCRMRNFDYVGTPPQFSSNESFLVRETQDTVLRKGIVTSIMSTVRDNVHQLHAGPDGILAADIITKVGQDQGFSFLEMAAAPRDAAKRTYEATWGTHQRG